MEAYVNNATRQFDEAISQIDGLGTDSEPVRGSGPECDYESEPEVNDLCSQSSEETQYLLARPFPGKKEDHLPASSSSSGGTFDKLDSKDVKKQIVELLGPECPLISKTDMDEEIFRHRTLP